MGKVVLVHVIIGACTNFYDESNLTFVIRVLLLQLCVRYVLLKRAKRIVLHDDGGERIIAISKNAGKPWLVPETPMQRHFLIKRDA